MYFPRKTKMKKITFLTMVSKITIFKSFLLKELKDTKISIKGVTRNKEDITKQKESVEIMIHNKIIKIGKVYQYDNIECDIIL